MSTVSQVHPLHVSGPNVSARIKEWIPLAAPIIGASKMEQLEQAIGAVEIALSGDEIKLLEEPYTPHATLGH